MPPSRYAASHRLPSIRWPCRSIVIDEFYIDTFPVTNADYARFCTATGHAPPRHWEGGRCARPLYDHPLVEVSWRDACAFAAMGREIAAQCTAVGESRAGNHGHSVLVG